MFQEIMPLKVALLWPNGWPITRPLKMVENCKGVGIPQT
jgi:hypothetical protein